MEKIEHVRLMAVPPLSIGLHQELIEVSSQSSDGVMKKTSYLKEILFSLSCSVTDQGVTLIPMEMSIRRDTPASRKLYPSVLFFFSELFACNIVS